MLDSKQSGPIPTFWNNQPSWGTTNDCSHRTQNKIHGFVPKTKYTDSEHLITLSLVPMTSQLFWNPKLEIDPKISKYVCTWSSHNFQVSMFFPITIATPKISKQELSKTNPRNFRIGWSELSERHYLLGGCYRSIISHRSARNPRQRCMELLPTTSVAAHAYVAVVILDVTSWRCVPQVMQVAWATRAISPETWENKQFVSGKWRVCYGKFHGPFSLMI